MFEILKEQPADQAIGGVYYAVRLITEMKGLKEPWSTIVDGLANLPSESGELDHRIGNQIIDDIERAEGKRLREIPPEIASKYIVNLAQQLEDVVQKTSRYDQQRGNRLLEMLRSPASEAVPRKWPAYMVSHFPIPSKPVHLLCFQGNHGKISRRK